MYEIQIDSEKMELRMIVSGSLDNKEVAELFDQVEKEIQNIDISKFALILDAKKHKPSSTNSMSLQEKAIKLLSLYRILV
ncbi:hypothetical protein R9X47_09070 [Wukongibacter baidiensis]|uniref:hypothetical protein n=1 Tax=Wukongibacter baidiensis TaxID=1723361 RepID=UPI003D7FE694